MAGGIICDARETRKRAVWPSAEWGSLPSQGGVEVAHRTGIEKGKITRGVNKAV